MTQTILILLVIGIGLFYATKYGNKAKKDIAEYQKVAKKSEQNNYTDLRKMAFSVTAEQLGLNTIAKDKVYGIVSEINMEGAIVTFVTFLTGDTSLYTSSNVIIIGAGQQESVKKVATKFVKNGQKYLKKATIVKTTDLPTSGMTNFYFLTENGVFIISQSVSGLSSGNSEFSNLFVELNNVITEVRLTSEK